MINPDNKELIKKEALNLLLEKASDNNIENISHLYQKAQKILNEILQNKKELNYNQKANLAGKLIYIILNKKQLRKKANKKMKKIN